MKLVRYAVAIDNIPQDSYEMLKFKRSVVEFAKKLHTEFPNFNVTIVTCQVNNETLESAVGNGAIFLSEIGDDNQEKLNGMLNT